jgi:hypothetical protein
MGKILTMIKYFFEKHDAFIATLILAFIAYLQFQQLNTTSSANFIHQLSDSVFTDKARILLELIDEKSLTYNKSNYTFAIDKGALKEKNLTMLIKVTFGYDKRIFSCYEIDDLLLSKFEDLGLLEQKGIVDIDMAYVLFDWPIEVTWENNDIQKYIQIERKEEGKDTYDKCEYIYNKFVSLKKKMKNSGQSILYRKEGVKE